MSKKIPIRIDFEGEDAKRFNTVKETRGVKANNELIRLLIADAYNEIRQKKQQPVEVPAR
jgi:hypothetical protein